MERSRNKQRTNYFDAGERMIKNGKLLPCTYCDKVAIPGSDPPVCEDHKDAPMKKKASEGPSTMKELESLKCSSSKLP